MAITIKNIPVLEGTTAEEFVRSADENTAKATPRLSASAKKGFKKFWRNPVHSVLTDNGQYFVIRKLRYACLQQGGT